MLVSREDDDYGGVSFVGLLDGREDDEYNGFGIVKMSEMVATHNTVFIEMGLFHGI